MKAGRQAWSGKILAVHPGALGDVILFGWLMSNLPGEVTLVAKMPQAGLVEGLGMVEGVMDFDALPMHELFFIDDPPEQSSLDRLIGCYDGLISCLAGREDASSRRLARMCGAGASAFLPIRPPEGYTGHLLEHWAEFFLDCDPPVITCPARPVPPDWRKMGLERLSSAGVPVDGDLLVIHPGSGGGGKNWPLERFVGIARRISDLKPGSYRPLFVVGPVESDRWDPIVLEGLKAEFTVVVNPPVEDLAGMLSLAKGYIGNDSGVSHLAGVVGVPSVVLFGPTDPGHFAPLGPAVRAFRWARFQASGDDLMAELLRLMEGQGN